MTDSQKLIAEYTRNGSEAAFHELVARYVDLVYSAALRLVNGDCHSAEDISQTVFADLARMAQTLSPDVMLGGWLPRHTCFAASKTIRSERRRQLRERQAVEMNSLQQQPTEDFSRLAPILDEAINTLSEPDRTAILLKFFEQHDFRKIGEIIGSNEDAARMRVNRALEKLEQSLKGKGIQSAAAALSVALSANAVQAAPAALAMTISTAALTGAAISTSTITTQGTIVVMNWINAKAIVAIAAACLAAGTGTYLYEQQKTENLRLENQSLLVAQEQLSVSRDAALKDTGLAKAELERLRKDQAELLRLRGEVGSLRKQSNQLAKLQKENQKLRDSLNRMTSSTPADSDSQDTDPQRQMAMAKLSDAKMLMLVMIIYANEHQNQIPTDFNQTSNYLSAPGNPYTGTNQFELVVHGSIDSITNASSTIAAREMAPWYSNGKWFKAYGFADGHAELHTEPTGNFDEWEKQRMMPPPLPSQ